MESGTGFGPVYRALRARALPLGQPDVGRRMNRYGGTEVRKCRLQGSNLRLPEAADLQSAGRSVVHSRREQLGFSDLLVNIRRVCSDAGIRTPNLPNLNRTPLPVGLHRHTLGRARPSVARGQVSGPASCDSIALILVPLRTAFRPGGPAHAGSGSAICGAGWIRTSKPVNEPGPPCGRAHLPACGRDQRPGY